MWTRTRDAGALDTAKALWREGVRSKNFAAPQNFATASPTLGTQVARLSQVVATLFSARIRSSVTVSVSGKGEPGFAAKPGRSVPLPPGPKSSSTGAWSRAGVRDGTPVGCHPLTDLSPQLKSVELPTCRSAQAAALGALVRKLTLLSWSPPACKVATRDDILYLTVSTVSAGQQGGQPL